MRRDARGVLADSWSRVLTSLHLLAAIARAARRHKALLLFPALTLLVTTALFLGILVLETVLSVYAADVPPMALVVASFGLLVLFFALQYVATTFFNVALTFAALRAFRDEETSPRAALAHAFARLRPIVAYSALAIAAGLLAVPLAVIPRSRAFLGRLIPSLAVASSIVPLIAIPVLVREPRGALAAIRRAVTLFRERWAETSIAVVSLTVLWLPLAAASLFVFQHVPSNPSVSGGYPVWLGLILLVCTTPILVNSFVRTMYGAALYVLAVEGVVPKAFDTAELTTVWRVGNVPAPGGPQAAETISDKHARRALWWAPVAALAAVTVVAIALAGSTSAVNQPFRQVTSLMSGSRPGLAVNDQNFPDRLQMIWSRKLPGPISGLAVRPEGRIVVGAAPTIFVLDRDGRVIQQFANDRRTSYGAFVVSGALVVSADLPGTAGTSFLVSGKWSAAIDAYDSSGARRWSWQMAEGGDAVDDIAAIREPGGSDLLAVGHNGFGGLCLVDGRGVERWCNESIGNVQFVTTIDCDRDGRDEIVSKSPHSHPFFGSKLGCYSTGGKLVTDLDVPVEPYGLRAVDVRGNGHKDLLAWYKDGLSGPLVLAAWTLAGRVLGELRLNSDANYASATMTAARLRAGHDSDIAVALPDGWVVGTSLDGERWGHRVPGADGVGLVLAAVDAGGAQELIIASGTTVSAWSWNGRAASARQ